MTITNAHVALQAASIFYCLAVIMAFLVRRQSKAFLFFLVPAAAGNLISVILRYYIALPMLPMHLGNAALPLCLAILAMLVKSSGPNAGSPYRVILLMATVISLAAVLFPKDFYLPFIRSKTLFAHLFFLFGLLCKSCLFVAAAWALKGLATQRGKASFQLNTGQGQPNGTQRSPLERSLPWTVWGFAFWTFSMFAGEMWSYFGWGTPVVWDDPAITTAMATWFFYICLLHLHLTGSWNTRSRGVYATAGALVVFCLNCIPEMGPLRWPI